MTWTKEKANEYAREHYRKNKAAYLEKSAIAKKKQRIELRSIIDSAKSKPCADCKNEYPVYVMQFDHIFDKKITIANAVSGIAKKKLLDEIAKCEVVCANCHAIRTHKRRTNAK